MTDGHGAKPKADLPGPIPRFALTAWRRKQPWRDDRQVEQDLYLSRAAIAIGSHPALAETLSWRGGTCLHKLHLDVPRRYSEDLDYVQVTGSKHQGWLFDALREAATQSDMLMKDHESSAVRVKAWFSAKSNFSADITVKVEINTSDVEPAMGLECHGVYGLGDACPTHG